MAVPEQPPIVFLSSVFEEEQDGTRVAFPLRRDIVDAASALPIALKAHRFDPEAGDHLEGSADSIIDRCFADIKACDLFVFLQSHRHGSGVLWSPGDPTVSTYLELELFAAALMRKPILILHERGFEPAEELADLLRILDTSFGRKMYLCGDRKDLVDAFCHWAGSLVRGEDAVDPQGTSGRIAELLSRMRSSGSERQDLENPSLFFLNGWAGPVARGGDFERARRLIDEVAAGTNQSGQPLSHGAALFRLWAAMRELMPLDRRDISVEAAWDQVLALWAIKASWFGAHGHIFLGPLAAINSQIALRRSKRSVDPEEARPPLTAKASALYSVSERMATRERKLRHLNQSILQATEALALDPSGQSGTLAIRGHAWLRMARMGYPWRLLDSKGDFAEALRLREQAGASAAGIGEAEADLGLVLVMTGRPFKGFAMVRHGVELLRQDESANAIGFLTRGMRKLELAARLTLRRRLAAEVCEERQLLARSVDALDQVRFD